jgi:hypothetical protein
MIIGQILVLLLTVLKGVIDGNVDLEDTFPDITFPQFIL